MNILKGLNRKINRVAKGTTTRTVDAVNKLLTQQRLKHQKRHELVKGMILDLTEQMNELAKRVPAASKPAFIQPLTVHTVVH